MIKTYKPSPIKPVTSEIWGPVSLTDWKLEGDGIIDTQFAYTTKINALFDRTVPGAATSKKDLDKAYLNYQIIPTLARYGTVSINPAGSLLVLDKKQIIGNAALTESNIVAYNAIASLINQQRTDLDLTRSVRNYDDTNYPIIPIYMRAMMYNSQTLIKPALHIKSMFGYLESLVKVNNKAAIRITQILNKFKQNKFVKPYNEYLELLSATPLHSETVNSFIDFFHIEKLNDAFNTSYDYVLIENTVDKYNHDKFNMKGVFNIAKRDAANNPVGAVINLLLDNSLTELDYLKNRKYLQDLLMMILADDITFTDALDKFIDKYLINNLITIINKTISMISSLPTIFQAFYAALPFLAEYIDTSIFSVKDFVNLDINIRRSSYYSKGNVMTNVELSSNANSIYPTWTMQVPLYNGHLEPTAPFNTNGLLYFHSDNQDFILANAETTVAKQADKRRLALPNCTYVPFVDISKMALDQVIIASSKTAREVKSILDVTEQITTITDVTGTTQDEFILYVSLVEIDNIAGAIKIPVKDDYFADIDSYSKVMRDKLAPFINWVVVKSDHAVIEKGKDNIVMTSPLLTGFRQVEITPVADVVRKATPKLLGFKKVGSL